MQSLTSRAEAMLAQAKKIDAYLEAKKLASPTFDNDTLADLAPEMEDLRASLANDSNDFRNLVRGPVMRGMDIAFSWTDFLSLRIICHYKLAQLVPLDGSATYAEIATKAGLDEDVVFRFLRAAMGNQIFKEDPTTKKVCHTALSRRLAQDTGFNNGLGLQLEELGPAGMKLAAAWSQWGQTAAEPDQTAFALVNEDLSIYQILGKYPERAKRFGGAMQFYTKDAAWDLRHLLAAADWGALDQPGTQLIDIGGGFGQVSQYLARNTEQIHFQVQDLPHVVPTAIEALPADMKERVSFSVHNFLEPQKAATPVDAILMRWVLHNWHDEYCVKILRALIPVLKNGTKIFIYEYLLDEGPTEDLEGRFGMQLDMIMLACFNGRERSASRFEAVLAAADKRFVLTAVRKPAGSTMGLVEVTWKE